MKTKKLVWKEREADLKKVLRFHDPKHRFEVMFYRTNLLVHTQRVPLIIEELIPMAINHCTSFDPKLALLIGKHHDDPELVAKRGDMSFQLKLKMEEEDHTGLQRATLKREEIQAINKIARFYPSRIEGYSFKEILMHALLKDRFEAQIHSLADKWEGCCESLHEGFAGNTVFFEPVLNYYFKFFTERHERLPLLKSLFKEGFQNPFLQFPTFSLMELFDKGKRPTTPHTKELLALNSNIPAYEAWKRITLEGFPNGLELLTTQVEFQQ